MNKRAVFDRESRARRGFTLIELLVVVALIALVAQLVVSNLGHMIPSTALTSQSNRFVAQLDFIRADAEVVFEPHSQKRRQEAGRYRLQVDRQTKATYATFEAAEAQGMIIKKQFKQVQVAIYDIQASSNTILELPA